MEWEAVIGLEIHVQLDTRSKIFSGASTKFGAEPNSQACPVDLGLPGVLPVVNAEVFKKAVAFGLGIGAEIGYRSVFDRKNYFYPDLPKGYQITQLQFPIVLGGQVEIALPDGTAKTIGVTRAHLEEDAGKSVHEDFHGMSGIDLNRAGTPLLEVVSEPDMRSAEEAVAYAKYIHQLVCYLDVSDGEMSQGSMRCDANVSIRPKGQTTLGTRTETKNVNSFRFLQRAINFEIARQIDVLEAGDSVLQDTLLYDPALDQTRPMRSKETATDYRYFPEPDLLPVVIDAAYVESIRSQLPELPHAKVSRFTAQYGLSKVDATILAAERPLADYFEQAAEICGDATLTANWVRVELTGQLNRENLAITESAVSAVQLGQLLLRIKDETISGKIAKDVFDAIWQGQGSADEIIAAKGLQQITNTVAIGPIVDEIIANNPKQVEQFRAGREKVLGFFIGQVMQATEGKANPKQVNEIVREKLKQ
ncbi:MAG: Asp-tRNA(Asn)/Glu-tRNA(Gln) amidotransferase subunit GatB [Pseudomonadales bacterium]|jgi:aspartyl-tRNA(Asn)/glutamyl-tRNA(Gln) amidotransferase subunit B|nr:Asp-tRNA(Asn)/Glu-tRNA(Gln) amidotransferase subunit GatB [Pseudomonadales bacterium]MDP7357191.1 Asp-tRNA(Asn)/Glu-tRNA(Gln) amidotransferase subunit GatB [Pseudomonadales bacterium]HJN50075.1 Asp-tRNA(Asn)/Glu-tRNA(Gln) amidotransferase subunit GatB [Pseudomonadales bacterium]|tara:strand:- start:16065 stop:17498 length:1434 start_codon:yes stop_codon:yes gene_type:complete